MARWELRVSGRVHGVFYRRSAEDLAVRLGLAGYVRNLPDGAVECVVEGEVTALDAFLAWARRGPPLAQVSGVEVVERPPTGERGFRMLR